MSSIAQCPSLTPSSQPLSEFFTHHGVWAPGVRLFRNLGFPAKASIITLAFLLPLLGMLGWQLKSAADAAWQARQAATRDHVDIAYGMLEWAHAQEKSGALTREQAQAAAQQAVAKLRYGGGKEYFWINDMQPRMVMHPIKPELDGKDLSTMADPNGLLLFNAFVDVVKRQGQGFVAYQWPRPGSERPVDKLSFVRGFEPWGWVVGSGIYVDDLHESFVAGAVLHGLIASASVLLAGYLFFSFYRVMDGVLTLAKN